MSRRPIDTRDRLRRSRQQSGASETSARTRARTSGEDAAKPNRRDIAQLRVGADRRTRAAAGLRQRRSHSVDVAVAARAARKITGDRAAAWTSPRRRYAAQRCAAARPRFATIRPPSRALAVARIAASANA